MDGALSKAVKTKTINLALQGGGSHGAFTWGVLDALLEDGRLEFDGVSGTSAGAMNAVAMAAGMAKGGRDGARQKLREFWMAVGEKGRFSPIRRNPLDVFFGKYSFQYSPSYWAADLFSRVFSPYDTNPLDINPLRDVVESVIDFDDVSNCQSFKTFVAATNVWTGKGRVFSGDDLTADAVMASACLPTMYKAVEIEGVPYWDGGFGGNPALYPFFYSTDTEDTLLVQINPVERRHTPKSAQEIQDRMNEITFNAGLLREFRAIEFVRRLKREGRLDDTTYSSIRMHRVCADEALADLSAATKLNAEWRFLENLHDLGYAAGQDFLDEHFDAIGERPTLDLSEELEQRVFPIDKKKTVGRRLSEKLQRIKLKLD
jgi:NTE family protein